jgi:alpha-glucosidase
MILPPRSPSRVAFIPEPEGRSRRRHFPGLSLLLTLCAAQPVAAGPAATLASPDGALVFTLDRDETSQALTFTLTHSKRPVVSSGTLGLELSGAGVVGTRGTVNQVEEKSADSAWSNPFGERSMVPDRYREKTLTLTHPDHGNRGVKLQVRAYDQGLALRYLLTGSGTIAAEKTSFTLPATTQVWTSARAQSPISKQSLSAVTGAVDRPVLAELAPDLFAALGEAALLDSARMKFTRRGTATLAAVLDGKVDFTDSFTSPWRFVRVGTSPVALLEGNDFMLNLNAPSAIADSSWIRPGKVLREVTLTTTGGLACIDFAASHGLQYILFDAGWYGPERSHQADATGVNLDPARSRGTLDLPKVIAYGKTKNIGVILYVNQIALTRQLDQILPLYQKWGVAGIKFGFVNVGPQPATRWLHEAVAKCAAHRLLVDIHDEYRPTGVSRTWPNLLTQEGIRGDEESPTNAAVLDTLFTRCLAGAGDQTNCYFAPRIATMGSHASQLAKAVLIFSPWQFLFWYDRPPGAPGPPSIVPGLPDLDFFKRLPTTWDETRWLDGYPGTHATVARRRGDTWFIGALNGPAARDFRLPLAFLTAERDYRLELFSDDPAGSTVTKVRLDASTVNSTTVIERKVAAGNGFAAVLTPVR